MGDVSSAEDVERWLETVERELGPVDLLAANAGISIAHEDVWEVEPEEWWHVHEVNVLGVFLCCRAVIPSMLGAQAGANRRDGEWRRVPSGGAVDRLHVEQGGRASLRGNAREPGPGANRRLLHSAQDSFARR